jgi:hypothetical protein
MSQITVLAALPGLLAYRPGTVFAGRRLAGCPWRPSSLEQLGPARAGLFFHPACARHSHAKCRPPCWWKLAQFDKREPQCWARMDGTSSICARRVTLTCASTNNPTSQWPRAGAFVPAECPERRAPLTTHRNSRSRASGLSRRNISAANRAPFKTTQPPNTITKADMAGTSRLAYAREPGRVPCRRSTPRGLFVRHGICCGHGTAR